MANNYVVTAIAAVAGARILYILTNLQEFDSLGSMFAMRRGGLVAYGGFLGGFAGSFFFLRRHKIPLLPWADVAVPSLASGLMITRIGCYLFGCDFGQPLKERRPRVPQEARHLPPLGRGHARARRRLARLGPARQGSRPRAHLDRLAAGPPDPALRVAGRPGAARAAPLVPPQAEVPGRDLLPLRLRIRRLPLPAGGPARRRRARIHPPALPEHILLPLGLAVLAVGWVIGFSHAIQNKTAQRASQVVAFVPVVALYFALKPAPGQLRRQRRALHLAVHRHHQRPRGVGRLRRSSTRRRSRTPRRPWISASRASSSPRAIRAAPAGTTTTTRRRRPGRRPAR